MFFAVLYAMALSVIRLSINIILFVKKNGCWYVRDFQNDVTQNPVK